ncbi:hypothetical protein BH11ARM1_BH11ARM1_05540 [soil metagenome]
MIEPRPLTEQELVDWERWAKREIKWEGKDVSRLIATVRQLQAQLKKESEE